MINEGPFSKGAVIMNAPPSPDLIPEVPLSRLARWAFICAIAGFAVLPALVVAPILGFVALSRPALKTGAERGRGLAKAAIAIGIGGTILSVSLIWVGVSGRLDTARTQVADATALSIGSDAVAIASVNLTAPTGGDLVAAVSETSGTAVLVSVNGASAASVTSANTALLRSAKLTINQPLGPVDVCLNFPEKLNASPKVVACP
jgi:hypothetical protein